jgi:hypothetical protein
LRIRHPEAEAIAVPEDAAVDSNAIPVPNESNLLETIKALPVSDLYQVSACYWGHKKDGKLVPAKGQFSIFGRMDNGAVFDLTIGQNSNGEVDNNIAAGEIQHIMRGLGLHRDDGATEKRTGKKSGEYYVVYYV